MSDRTGWFETGDFANSAFNSVRVSVTVGEIPGAVVAVGAAEAAEPTDGAVEFEMSGPGRVPFSCMFRTRSSREP